MVCRYQPPQAASVPSSSSSSTLTSGSQSFSHSQRQRPSSAAYLPLGDPAQTSPWDYQYNCTQVVLVPGGTKDSREATGRDVGGGDLKPLFYIDFIFFFFFFIIRHVFDLTEKTNIPHLFSRNACQMNSVVSGALSVILITCLLAFFACCCLNSVVSLDLPWPQQ